MTQLSVTHSAHRALVCLCILGVLAGCSGHLSCTKPEVYERSTAGPPLRVPPDLSPPPEDGTFDIPPAPRLVVSAPPCGHYPPKIATAKKPAPPSAAPTTESPQAAPPAATQAAPVIQVPPPPATATTQAGPAAPLVSAAEDGELRAVVAGWARSWDEGDFEQYLQYYSQDFDPPGDLTPDEWRTARRGILDKHPTLTIAPDSFTVVQAASGLVVVQFVQSSQVDGVTSTLRKGLVLVRDNDAWRIQQEYVVDVLSNPR